MGNMYVKLPQDADGRPINIGDTLYWNDNGDMQYLTVAYMTYYGDDINSFPAWVAYDETDTDEGFSDNLANSRHVPDKSFSELMDELSDIVYFSDGAEYNRRMKELGPQIITQYRREHK